MWEKIKALYERFRSPYLHDTRRYNQELYKKFEDSDIDEVV